MKKPTAGQVIILGAAIQAEFARIKIDPIHPGLRPRQIKQAQNRARDKVGL